MSSGAVSTAWASACVMGVWFAITTTASFIKSSSSAIRAGLLS
jgi:hypothetical protein